MSDHQQGPGWWLASDGKWYPPESASTAASTAAPVAPSPQPAAAAIPVAVWPALAGAALLALGALLPWATVTAPFIGQISKNGVDGDGIITLLFGAAVGVLAFVVISKRTIATGLAIAVLVLSALSLLIGVIDLVDVAARISDVPDDVPLDASPGIGLYLTVLGGAAGIAGGIMLLLGRSGQPTGAAPPSF